MTSDHVPIDLFFGPWEHSNYISCLKICGCTQKILVRKSVTGGTLSPSMGGQTTS